MSASKYLQEWNGLPVKVFSLNQELKSDTIYRVAFDLDQFYSSSGDVQSSIKSLMARSMTSGTPVESLPGVTNTGGGPGFSSFKIDGMAAVKPLPDLSELLDDLFSRSDCQNIPGLILGMNEQIAMDFQSEANQRLVESKELFPNLKFLYLGEITEQESPLHDIDQGDVGKSILEAFPGLVELRARGGSDGAPIVFNQCRNICLNKLVIETAGLKADVLESLSDSILPELAFLDLWFGSPIYGCDLQLENVEAFLDGCHFPKLNHIAFKFCEIPGILSVVLKSKVLRQLTSLDLSYSELCEADGELLLKSRSSTQHLERMKITGEGLSESMMRSIRELENIEILEPVD